MKPRAKRDDHGQPITSSEARGFCYLCQPIKSSEAWSLSYRFKAVISSEARGSRNFSLATSSSKARDVRYLCQPIFSSEAISWIDFRSKCLNLYCRFNCPWFNCPLAIFDLDSGFEDSNEQALSPIIKVTFSLGQKRCHYSGKCNFFWEISLFWEFDDF